MRYLVFVVVVILLLDIIRSCLGMRKVSKLFHAEYRKKKKLGLEKFGNGKAFHLVIMGDSTFDVRGDTTMPYGPAQVFIDKLAEHYTVHVHLLARAGAKSYDVIATQLPKLKALAKVDLVVVYMGANNAVYFKSPFPISKDYQKLLAFTEARAIPVAASEVANYWHFSLFSLVQRAWLYVAIHIENARIRQAFEGTKHASLFALKQVHNAIHKERHKEPYLLDGFHPNDASNVTFGKAMLEANMKHPAIDALFKNKV
jgi:lysophospholipase L1-like esterase